jgi:hypothetical protein
VCNHTTTRFPPAAALLFIALFFVTPVGAIAADSVNARLQSVIETLRGKNIAVVGKASLTNIATIIAFYERGAMTLTWSWPGALDELRRAIRTAEGDGLRAADYHLVALDPCYCSIRRVGRANVSTRLFAQDAYDYDRDVRAALDAPMKRAAWWPAQ